MLTDLLKKKGISDAKVLAAMQKVPRHLFVEEALRHRAYGDYSLPIGSKQTISQPYMVALMTQHLMLTGKEKVLEIGTGSGYQSAILCELAGKVYTVERITALGLKARAVLDHFGYLNISTKIFDGTYGWNEYAPYDRIIVTAAAPSVPANLINQLAPGGIMVIPVGDDNCQTLLKVEKEGTKIKTSEICNCTFVPLIGAQGREK